MTKQELGLITIVLAIALMNATMCNVSADEPTTLRTAPSVSSAGSPAPSINAANFNQLLNRVGISAQFGNQVPLDVRVVNADGREVRLGDCLNGRPTILHLVYYQCPMLCKLTQDGLLRTLSTLNLKLGRDYSVVTLSFDPREGPELSARARQLAGERCGRDAVDHGWTFLTGSQESIAAITSAVGFRYTFDETTRQFAHAAGIFVLTPDGKVSRFLSGADYAPRDVRLALVDASDGKIGTTLDHAMLLCYMYDPTAGKYGLAIMAIMRTAGLLTVGTLALSIVTMVRRDRRRQAARDLNSGREFHDVARGGQT